MSEILGPRRRALEIGHRRRAILIQKGASPAGREMESRLQINSKKEKEDRKAHSSLAAENRSDQSKHLRKIKLLLKIMIPAGGAATVQERENSRTPAAGSEWGMLITWIT